MLTIAADFNTNKADKKEAYLYSERRSGHMERSFNLEGIDQEHITADYVDGVLSVRLPKMHKAEEKNSRRIAIGSGAVNA